MDYAEMRWALQLIAEEGIGRAVARAADHEDDAMKAARQRLGG